MASNSPNSIRRRNPEKESTTNSSQKASNNEAKPQRRAITKNEFKQRDSHLDSLGANLEKSEFRGFFNLITMGLFYFFLAAETRKLMSEGTLVGLGSAWDTFNRYDLFPAWLIMGASSFCVVLLQKLILLRIFPRLVVSLLRIMLQVVFFAWCLFIAVYSQWPIIQSTFFLAELLVLSMKMHSYIMTNREYDKEYVQRTKEKKDTTENQKNVDEEQRKESFAFGIEKLLFGKTEGLTYPENVSFRNYFYFLLVPTMVYELEYPRTKKIRVAYIVEKISSFIGLWAVLHVLCDSYIVPVLQDCANMTHIEAVSHTIIPITGGYLIVFYMVFDVGCNGFAEITRFADRQFYTDWWNSNSWDEFARNWNKPVHEFLLRHVYLESINTYKMSKTNATLVTFLFSSIVHEFFMAFTLRLFVPWLFFFQMSQVPLIYIFRHPFFKNSRFGNHFFWFGLLLGVPLLTILYGREYCLRQLTKV